MQLLKSYYFWATGAQSQNTSKYGPKVDFEISHLLESRNAFLIAMVHPLRVWCKNGVHSTFPAMGKSSKSTGRGMVVTTSFLCTVKK